MDIVIVLVLAGNCGHCVHFKPEWAKMKPQLIAWAASQKINIECVEVFLSSMDEITNIKNFPKKEIVSHVRGFPTIFAVSKKVWNSSGSGTSFPKAEMFDQPRSLQGFQKWISVITGKLGDVVSESHHPPTHQKPSIEMCKSILNEAGIPTECKNEGIKEIKKNKIISSIHGIPFEISGDR